MTSLRSSGFLGSFLLLVIIVQCLSDQDKPRMLISVAIVWIAVACLFTVYMLATHGSLRVGQYLGVNHQWGNRFGNSLALCVPIIWYGHRQRLLSRSATTLAVFSITAIIGLAQSRGGVISLVLAVVACATYDILSKRRLRLVDFTLFYFIGGIATAAFVVLLVLTPYGQFLVERLSSTDLASYLSADSANASRSIEDYGRKAHTAAGMQMLAKPTLLGIGYMAFGEHLERSIGLYIISHNIFFTALGELGILGFVLASYFFFTLLVRLRRGYVFSDGPLPEFRSLYPYLAIALFIALVQWQWRPQHDNVVLFVMIGVVLNQHSFRGASRRGLSSSCASGIPRGLSR
jgi:hypothetical protein